MTTGRPARPVIPFPDVIVRHGLLAGWEELDRLHREHGGLTPPFDESRLAACRALVEQLLIESNTARTPEFRARLAAWLDLLRANRSHFPEYDMATRTFLTTAQGVGTQPSPAATTEADEVEVSKWSPDTTLRSSMLSDTATVGSESAYSTAESPTDTVPGPTPDAGPSASISPSATATPALTTAATTAVTTPDSASLHTTEDAGTATGAHTGLVRMTCLLETRAEIDAILDGIAADVMDVNEAGEATLQPQAAESGAQGATGNAPLAAVAPAPVPASIVTTGAKHAAPSFLALTVEPLISGTSTATLAGAWGVGSGGPVPAVEPVAGPSSTVMDAAAPPSTPATQRDASAHGPSASRSRVFGDIDQLAEALSQEMDAIEASRLENRRRWETNEDLVPVHTPGGPPDPSWPALTHVSVICELDDHDLLNWLVYYTGRMPFPNEGRNEQEVVVAQAVGLP